ncbi:hypothetical protein ABEB36_003284 [Hypothenemus hampei]|uniref:Ionotropic glutamate receptor C-terminal domain-containing protein n=1 Tax=Hypothenemus hampei TaxID=57062 RepID=A0ABD1F9D4_HYPHA
MYSFHCAHPRFSTQILLNILLNTYFSSSRCILVINPNNLSIRANVPTLNLDKSIRIKENLFNYIGCTDFLLDVAHPVTDLQLFEREIKFHPDRFNNRKYIFISRNPQDFKLFHLQEIHYFNNLLLISCEKDLFSFWTHKYVGTSGNNDPYLLDKWFINNASFLHNNNLFPDKLTDQQGRTLKVATITYIPYSINDSDTYFYMGSQMITMKLFADYHNLIVMPVINEKDYWGELWENWSGNGLMGNVVLDRADIGGASLYIWEFVYTYLDMSMSTIRTGVSCLVPAPKLLDTWLTPTYAYNPYTWIVVAVTFVASFLTLYLIMEFQANRRNFFKFQVKLFIRALMIVVKPFIMQNVPKTEVIKGLLGRYLMGLIFMTTLILSIMYDSGLATTMTIPYYQKPIDTVEDFVDSGLPWTATQIAWIMSIEDAKEPNMIKLVSKFKVFSEETLRMYSHGDQMAFAFERLPNENYAIGPYIQKDVIENYHMMRHDIYWAHSCLVLRKHSNLLQILDMFILKVFEAGLINFWQNEVRESVLHSSNEQCVLQAATKYINPYVQKVVKYLNHHSRQEYVVKLKMMHVQGAFGILIFGSILAFLVFLSELFHYKFYKLDVVVV